MLPIPPTSSLSQRPGSFSTPSSTYPNHRLATLLYTSLRAPHKSSTVLNQHTSAVLSTSPSTSPDDRSPYHSPAQPSSHPIGRPARSQKVHPSVHLSSYKECDVSIQLECEQMIATNEEDSGVAGLENSDWEAMRTEHGRCYGTMPNSLQTSPHSPEFEP